VTAAMAAISALATAVAVLAAFSGAGAVAAAPIIWEMYKVYEAAGNIHEVLLAAFSVAFSFMAIVGVLKHLAEIALWSPWLVTFGVPALAVSRLRGIGALFLSLAVVSIVVSYVAGAYAADAYATAQWAQAIANWAVDLAKEWQTGQNVTAGGSPAYVYMWPGALWIGHYNSTFSLRALEGLYQDLKSDPVLGNDPRAVEAWRDALEAWKLAYNTTLLARNVTAAPLYGGLVAAVEYGNKTWFFKRGNAADELKALVAWLDMDVYVNNASLCSRGMLAPAERDFLQRFLQRWPDKRGEFTTLNETAHRLCRYLERNGLLQAWVFTWDGKFRSLVQPYAYNVTYHVDFKAGNAYGVAGAWGWVVPPEGEKCYDALGKEGGCESLLASLRPGFYKYDAASGRWAAKVDPTPGAVKSVWNFTVGETGGSFYVSKSVDLYHYAEYCRWCAQWVNGTCVDWRLSWRDWYEKYRVDWNYTTRYYNVSVAWVDKPWRPSHLARPTSKVVEVPWTEAIAIVKKWWEAGPWVPEPPGVSCEDHWTTTPDMYKAVTIFHTPNAPAAGYVYGWAWLSRADVSYTYNSTTLVGLVSTGPQEDVWMEGAVQSAYCTLAMAQYPYWAVDDETLRWAIGNLTEINRKALAAGITYNNLTARWWQLRHLDAAFQKLKSDIQRAMNSPDEEERRDAEVVWNLVQFYNNTRRIDVGQLAFLPPPHETPEGYQLHQYHVVCINFHWDAVTVVNGTTEMEPAALWTLWNTGFPLGYTNLTDFLIGRLAEFYARLFRKGFPPPPKNVTLVAWLGDRRFEVKGYTRFASAGGTWWWDGSPLPYTPVDYNKTGSLPASVWEFPVYDIYGIVFQALVLMASIAGEAWARMVAGGLYALGAFEALGLLFGFPTPTRLLYGIAVDILSQLGYWLGIRIAIRARLLARLLRPVRAYMARWGRAIATVIPLRPPFRRPREELLDHVPRPVRDVLGWLWDAAGWIEARIRQTIVERLRRAVEERLKSHEVEEAAREAARSAAEAARQAALEAAKRTWHALHSHDVVEAARRISARADALFRTMEEKLVEAHPALAVALALYRGPYGVGVVLSEGVIRWLMRTGRITAQEAEELRRLRHLFWAMAAESRARAVAMEKADEEALRRFYEHREKALRLVFSTVEQVKKATSKEDVEKALYSAAEHLARIDLRAVERVREAFELAAFGKRVGIDTTAKLAEALWERRTALEAIVERAKELLRMHYESAPLSYEELRHAALMRQITLVKPLYAALAEARRYAAEGGVEGAKRAYEALKAVRPFERFGEVELKELRSLAKRALSLEERLAAVEEEIVRVRELLPTADGQRASLEARLARLEAERAHIAERLKEIRARIRIETGEAIERIARTYRGFLEDARREVDPAFRRLRDVLLSRPEELEEAYRALRAQLEQEGRDVSRLDAAYQRLRRLAEELAKAREDVKAAVKRHEEVIRREAIRWGEGVQQLRVLLEAHMTAEDALKGDEVARALGLRRVERYLEEYVKYIPTRKECSVAVTAVEAAREKALSAEPFAKRELEETSAKAASAEKVLSSLRELHGVGSEEAKRLSELAKGAGLEWAAQFFAEWGKVVKEASDRGELEALSRLARGLAAGRLAEEAALAAKEGLDAWRWLKAVEGLKPLYERAVEETAKLKAVVELAKRLSEAVEKWRYLDARELRAAAQMAREGGFTRAAEFLERAADFKAVVETAREVFERHEKALKRLRALEQSARHELSKASAVAEGLRALLEGDFYEKLSEARRAARALGLSKVDEALARLGRVKLAIERVGDEFAYEVGGAVRRVMADFGVDRLLLRAPLSAYVVAIIDASLAREAASVFRQAFAKYQREVAATAVYLPVREAQKLGPAVSPLTAAFDFRSYVEELVKAGDLRRYYASEGRAWRELSHLVAKASEAVLDLRVARKALEKGDDASIALAIALAYRAAKAYMRLEGDIRPLADVVAEVRYRLGLYDRTWAEFVEKVEGGKAKAKILEALRPRTVEEAVEQLKVTWSKSNYRALEERLGLTRTYAIADANRALEYTAKALTSYRLAAMGFEEALSVARAQSLIRTAERYLKGRPLETPAREQPLYVARALSKPLPEVRPSAVDEVAREAVVRLLKEVEAGGAKAKALWRQVEELVKVSPEAFAEVVAYASSARGLAAHWARQLVARVRREWETYRELWQAPVSVRLERLRDVPAARVEAPVPRELVALALWAELASKARPTAAKDVEAIKRVVGEVSPVALEEARLRAERIRAVFEDIEKLKSVDLEKPVYIAFSSLEREVPGEGVKALVIDERAELLKTQRYSRHPDLRVVREGELLAKFAAGELSRSQLAEELRKLGGPYTQEGREAVEMPNRLKDLHAVLTAKLANEVAILRDVEELKRAVAGVAFHTAVRAGLGDEEAWRELRALAALDKAAEGAVKYAELLRILRALSEGLGRVVYEPELAKKYPEYCHVLLEREYALKKAEELRREGPERAIVAGLLEQFAEGRIKRSELLKAAEEKGVDLHEFSREKIRDVHGMVKEAVKNLAAEFKQYVDTPRSLRDLLEGRLPRGLYAKMAEELGVADVVYVELGVPAKYAKYGLVEGLERYVKELKKLVLQLPGDASRALVAIEALRGELSAITPADIVADIVNKRGEVLTRLKRALEEARAEVVKAVFDSVKTAGVRRIPRELLELAASTHFTPEELRMLLTELDAVRAVEERAVGWPSFAEYTPYIFATADEAVARVWRRGGGLVYEAYELTEAGPRRVFILAPKNAPIDEIREAFLSLRGVEIVGEPRWLSWDAVEGLGFVVERSEEGVAVRPKAEYQLSLEKPLPRTKEAWEVVKRFRPDVVREALGHGWEFVHWEDGVEAVNAYLFLRKFRGWERFGGEDVERLFDEFRRWYTPGLERHASVISRRMYGFDAVDWLKGAYAVWARSRGEFVAKYVHRDAEALARVIWWTKKWAWGRLYDLLEPDFKDPVVLKAVNIAVKRGFLSWGEALDLFHEWVRKNDIAKWDEEALRIALRGNITSEDYERAVRAFIASVKTAQQLEAESEALERWKMLQEKMREEAERARARRATKPRPEAAPKEEAKPREEVRQSETAVKPAEEAKEAALREEKVGGETEKAVEQREAAERPPSAEAAGGVEKKRAVEEKEAQEAEKVAEEEVEEFVRVGKVLVKRGYEDDAVVKAFAAEDPQNWFVKLTPEAYFKLREALAPAYLHYLERARDWAASRERALSILAARHGSIDVPKRVREKAAERARAVLERHAARLVYRYGEERAQAALVKIAVLLEQWVREGELPNAHAEILRAMWAWEGEERPSRVEREWGFWLFREHFAELKKTAEALQMDVMHLWNAYRAALERYLDVVFTYGGLVERAVTTVDKALYTTLAAAGGVALAEALQGVVRPEIVYTVSSAVSLALAGRYREAVDVVKTAVHNVELAVRRVAGEVKIAVERLYEAVVEAVARLLQWLGEHWRVLALVAAAVAASILTWMAAQHVLAAVDTAQFAKLASWGFFGLAGVKKADVDEKLDVVLSGLRTIEGLERGGLARVGHVSRGYASADFARLVEEAVKAKLEAETESLVRARLVGGATRGAVGQDEFDRFASNVVATVETALGLVNKVIEKGWEAKPRVNMVGRGNYAHTSKELVKAFDMRKKDMMYFLRYDVGDVTHGGAKAEGVVVLVFLGGEKTIRVEVLAKSVAGVPARFEEVEWGGEKWVRLAVVRIHKPSGKEHYVTQVEPKVERFVIDVSRGSVAGVDGLRGIMVTDASGKWIKTPDSLLVKEFASHFRRVRLEVMGVTYTQAGPALIFEAVALDDEPFKELFGDTAEKYRVELRYIVEKAKGMWLKAMYKLRDDIKRVADKATEVGRREGVKAGRKALVEGLRRLFEEKEREALSTGRSEEALAIAVAGRLMLDIVNSPREWLLLLAGDGVVDIAHKTLGFSAKYAEVAEAVLRLLAVWAGVYGAEIRIEKEESVAVYANVEDATRVLKALLAGDMLEYVASLTKSWSGLAGSNAPKLISLLALAQLLGVVEGKWAMKLWLVHKAATTPTPPEVAKALDGFLSKVEGVEGEKWAEGGVNLYFRVRGVESSERAVVLRLYTDFTHFYFYCESYSGTSARRVLGAVAEELRLAVERLERKRVAKEGQKWPKWHWNALELPAGVGWPIFLKLWTRRNMSLPIEEGGRELLRVEVLDVRPDGSAKFRLWYYKWRETRSEQPYVDFEVKPYQHKGYGIRFRGLVYANEAGGIRREHLVEIAELLRREGLKGMSLRSDGKTLEFTGVFRDSVLGRLGTSPEFPRAEPVAVEHLGGLKFKVGGYEVEFGKKTIGNTREFYAVLKMSSADEAIRYAAALRAIGVDAMVAGNTVRLDSDSFFGLLVATNAVLPGLVPLYRSEDLCVYASVEEGHMRFYFAVKHGGVWRVVEGQYKERTNNIQLFRAERDVLETVRSAVAKALQRLDNPTDVGESGEIRDEEGNVVGYYLHLYGPHLKPFLEHAAESVKAKPAEVRLGGKRVVVKASSIEAAVEFKLLKFGKAEYFLAHDVGETLALYKSLKALGVPVEITPKGVKIDSEALWSLIATAVERSVPSRLPTEVMPGVELLNVHSASGMKLYIFRAEGLHYYFAVKTGEGWRVAGGRYSYRGVMIVGKAAEVVAKTINAIYGERGVKRKAEVRYNKGKPYIKLADIDLELLGLIRHE